MQRVVSLIPSATEIVCLLGLEGQLVGRSHECDYPPSVQRLPICTAPAERSQSTDARPTVACIEWLDPLMAGGNWLPELVDLAGGDNRFGAAGAHSPWMTWESLRESDPDVIVLLPCGFDIARTRKELPALTRQPGWSELRAVRGGRVYLTDGNQFFNRPGPRLVESLEILAEIIHPQCFSFGHESRGWQRLHP